VRRYLARYDAGPCTLIRPVRLAANEVRLEAFGKEAGPIQDFYQNFIRSFGFAPQVGARLVEDAQCAALDYLDDWLGRPGTLRLQLDRDVLSAGDALSGAISGLGERDLALVIVSDNGLVYSLNDMVTRNDEDAAFHTKISSTTPGGERPQLLFALASRPVPRLASDRPMRASDFFPLLAAALEESEGVEAAVAYFKFEG
jgi:serine/threonine-protein kinase